MQEWKRYQTLKVLPKSINNYKLLPFPLVNIAAIILPWIEVVAGILLIFGIVVKENASFIISFTY
jgi:putative oxidoreductase